MGRPQTPLWGGPTPWAPLRPHNGHRLFIANKGNPKTRRAADLLMGLTHTYGADPHLWGGLTVVGLNDTYGEEPHLGGGPTLMGNPTLMGLTHTWGVTHTYGADPHLGG